jgi:hypothetical protein
MDYNGKRGKSKFRQFLQYRQNFQSLKIFNARDAVAVIDETAGGYVFDLARSSEKTHKIYELIENIKDGEVGSGKYHGQMKYPKSNKIVVLANYFPNVAAMTPDRWELFHP